MASEAGQQFELPKHVAIIMDGNRRWAKQRNLATIEGHRAGFEKFKEIVDYAFSLGITHITVYAFSTENWNRTPLEVSAIMALAKFAGEKEFSKYSGRGISIKVLGRKQDLPSDLQATIEKIESKAKVSDQYHLNIAFSYGGRAEITDAVESLVESGEVINEENIAKHLYTAGQPDPELIIRTGGSPRLSNFLMWQSAYSEIYLTDTLWPDFDNKEFDKAIRFYKDINRNFGR